MIFNGQVRRPRQVNLGSKPAASRDATLRRAEQERDARARVRAEAAAATALQRAWRAHARALAARRARRDAAFAALAGAPDFAGDGGRTALDFAFYAPVLLERGPADAARLLRRLALLGSRGANVRPLSRTVSAALGHVWGADRPAGHDSQWEEVYTAAIGVYGFISRPYSPSVAEPFAKFVDGAPPAYRSDFSKFLREAFTALLEDHPAATLAAVLRHPGALELLDALGDGYLAPLYSLDPPPGLFEPAARGALQTLVRLLSRRGGPALPLLMAVTAGLVAQQRLEQEREAAARRAAREAAAATAASGPAGGGGPASGPAAKIPRAAGPPRVRNWRAIAAADNTLDALYTREFIREVAGAKASPQALADFLLTLLESNPRRKAEMLMLLTLASDEPLLHKFWNAFRATPLYTLTQVLPSSAHSLTDSPDWSLLHIMLETLSYWLVVSNDAEFFSNAVQGLALTDIRTLTELLRNLVFTAIWTRTPAARLLAMQPIMLTVIRQLYVRDSRRPYMPKGAWLMSAHMGFDTQGFKVTEDALEDEEADAAAGSAAAGLAGRAEDSDSESELEDDSDAEDEDSFQAAQRTRAQQALPPRVAILRQTPFFVPFRTRAATLQHLFEQMRAKLGDPFNLYWRERGDFLTIHRENVLEDTRAAFATLGAELRSPLRVVFYSNGEPEQGLDGGGLTKEVLTLVSTQIFDGGDEAGDYATLFVETDEHTLYPNPAYSGSTPPPAGVDMRRIRELYVFVGQVIGLCLYRNIMINVDFAPFFLAKWAGRDAIKSSFDDFYTMDHEVYNSLIQLYQYEGNVEDLALDFTVPGLEEEVELKPGGAQIPVTNANRLEYIHAVADYKLNTALGPQTRWMLQGVSAVVPLRWLKMFNAAELQTLLSGEGREIDVDDLRLYSEVSGFRKIRVVDEFWETVRELTPEQRSKLLRFVTSVPRGPLLGFKHLSPHFGIRSEGPNKDGRLPSASTCTNLLYLPEYSSRELLKERLLEAIESDVGFDLA